MNVRSLVIGGIVFSLCALAVPAPAAAEVIAINRGTFVFENDADNIGTLAIAGTHGFRLNARLQLADGHFGAVEFCDFSEECTPGAIVQIDAGWGGSALLGAIAQLRGKTYTDIGGAVSPNGGLVEFSGAIVMPAMDGGSAAVTAPFEFGGSFMYGPDEGSSQTAILTGGGFVTLLLEPGVGGSWIIRRAEFTFRPARRR